jgi:hypothetical protein
MLEVEFICSRIELPPNSGETLCEDQNISIEVSVAPKVGMEGGAIRCGADRSQ